MRKHNLEIPMDLVSSAATLHVNYVYLGTQKETLEGLGYRVFVVTNEEAELLEELIDERRERNKG